MSQFYTGVVESREDPLFLGRCRVRVVGIHNEHTSELPTEDLPWAHPLMPITSASMNGIGQSPLGPVEGTWVVVFFKDGDEFQQPIMMGSLGGIPVSYNDKEEYSEITGVAVDKIKSGSDSTEPTYQAADSTVGFKDPNGIYPRPNFLEEPDTNRLARGQKLKNSPLGRRISQRKKNMKVANSASTWDQPQIPYFAAYPYNHVRETESGHVVEYDDTPMAERICHMHTTGTFTEVDASGTQVNRIVGNGYTIIDRDGFVEIAGTCIISVAGDAAINVGGSLQLDVMNKININANLSDMNVRCNNFNINAVQSVNVMAGTSVNFLAGTGFSVSAGTGVDVLSGGMIAMDATQVHMNSGFAMPPTIMPVTMMFTPNLFTNPDSLVPHTAVDVTGLSIMDSIAPRKLDLLKKAFG